jgi:hypothetical protein
MLQKRTWDSAYVPNYISDKWVIRFKGGVRAMGKPSERKEGRKEGRKEERKKERKKERKETARLHEDGINVVLVPKRDAFQKKKKPLDIFQLPSLDLKTCLMMITLWYVRHKEEKVTSRDQRGQY